MPQGQRGATNGAPWATSPHCAPWCCDGTWKIRRSWEKWWISMVKNRDFIMENDGNMVEIMGIMVICWGCGKTKVFWTI